jgi:hypothetical protein
VAIDVGEDVLDENLAAELLAEKADVAANDRSEVEQRRRFARGQRREKLPQRLGGENGIVSLPGRRRPLRTRVRFVFARCETV